MKQTDIQTLENLVRSGKFREVKLELAKINLNKVPRELRASLSNIAYRINFPSFSIRILGPIVRQAKAHYQNASDNELVEYAIALSRLGATREAHSWLNKAQNPELKEVLLYKAFTYITEWNYAEAANYLRKYVEKSEVSDYQRLVAQTNLAAALIYMEKWTEAQKLLNFLRLTTKEQKHQLLYTNSLELSAQTCFFQNKMDHAQNYIKLGLPISPKSTAQIYLQKWQAVIDLHLNPKSHKPLLKVRAIASQKGLWESVRESDYYLAKYTGDQDLFLKVFFGTPHEHYRQKMFNNLNWPIELPEITTINLGKKTLQNSVLDLENATLDGNPLLKKGSRLHNLLKVLASDLYKPFRLGNLFSHLFIDEHYDPHSSPDRIHQLLKRLRSQLEPQNIFIEKQSFSYNLSSPDGLSIIMRKSFPIRSMMESRVDELLKVFATRPFKVKDVQDYFRVSRTQAHYIIREARSKGVQQIGKGPSSQYLIKAA